jgi:hypothetical protein
MFASRTFSGAFLEPLCVAASSFVVLPRSPFATRPSRPPSPLSGGGREKVEWQESQGGGKTHAPSSQNGGQGSKRGTPPVIRLVWSYLVVTGSGVRPSALGMWLRRHRERREAKETRDPGGTPTAGKHLCFSPPRPSTPWTLHIDIRVASGASQGVGGAGHHSPCNSTWPQPERSFSLLPTVVCFFSCVTVAIVYSLGCHASFAHRKR